MRLLRLLQLQPLPRPEVRLRVQSEASKIRLRVQSEAFRAKLEI